MQKCLLKVWSFGFLNTGKQKFNIDQPMYKQELLCFVNEPNSNRYILHSYEIYKPSKNVHEKCLLASYIHNDYQ